MQFKIHDFECDMCKVHVDECSIDEKEFVMCPGRRVAVFLHPHMFLCPTCKGIAESIDSIANAANRAERGDGDNGH